MTATVFFDNASEIANLAVTFQTGSPLVPADPTTVACVVTDPSGAAVTHTYAGAAPADITKVSMGKYQLNQACSPAVTGIDGLWSYVWIGTGAVSDVQPGTWRVLPQAIGTWYCGLEELKSRLGITDSADDYEAQIAIQAVSGWINDYVGRHFNRVTETRTYRPTDIWVLDIDDLVSVTALNIDRNGDGIFEEPWVQGADYQLRLGRGLYNVNATGFPRPYKQVQVIQAGRLFPFVFPWGHLDRVQITGTWGWPLVPPPVVQSALTLSAQWLKEKDAPFGVAGVSDYGVVKIQQNPWVVEQLRSFINPKRKIGV